MSMNKFAATNASLRALSSEAESLLDQARKYKEEMDALPSTPEGNAQREVYEKTIRDLLERAKRLSATVTAGANSRQQ